MRTDPTPCAWPSCQRTAENHPIVRANPSHLTSVFMCQEHAAQAKETGHFVSTSGHVEIYVHVYPDHMDAQVSEELTALGRVLLEMGGGQ